MVSSLYKIRNKEQFKKFAKKFNCDPKKALKYWKGDGYYYHRGKCHFSKYNPAIDVKKTAKHRSPHSRKGMGKWRHTNDIVMIKRQFRRIAQKKYSDTVRELAQDIYIMIRDQARAYKVKGITKRRLLKALLPAVKLLHELGVDVYAIDWGSIDLKHPEQAINDIVAKYGKRNYQVDYQDMIEAYNYYLQLDKERMQEALEHTPIPDQPQYFDPYY